MTAPSRSAIVLAGGGSRRMGRDKANLPFGPETVLQRVVRIISASVDEVIVVARQGQALAFPGRVVWDEVAEEGPLAGLIAGLGATVATSCAVVSCDQPLLEGALIEMLFSQLQGHDAAIPRVAGFLVPTCAAYRRDVIEVARAMFQSGERRLSRLADRIDARILEESDLLIADAGLASFRPCNTLVEYESLLRDAGLA